MSQYYVIYSTLTNKMSKNLHKNIMSVASRLKLIADENGLSLRKLSVSIGKTEGYLSVSLRKDTEVGSEALANILHKYPQYNIEWVLTGKGEKLKKDVKNADSDFQDVKFNKKKYTEETIHFYENEIVPRLKIQEKLNSKFESAINILDNKVSGLIGLAEIDSELILAMQKLTKFKSNS